MTVAQLIARLQEFNEDLEVSIAVAGLRIEGVGHLELDPYSDEPAVLIWPENVNP